MSRPAGSLEVMVQAWSRTAANEPGEPLGDQDYYGEYRLRWRFAMDEAKSGALLELKGSDEARVAPDDYFVKLEYMYRGIQGPFWLYGGLFAADDGDPRFYGGVETMSFTLGDLTKKESDQYPVAGKAYAEVRYNPDADNNPVLRLQVMLHSLPTLVHPIRVAVPFEGFFAENENPLWVIQPHLEARVFDGFVGLDLIAGYEYSFGQVDRHRIAVGAMATFGGSGK